MAGVKRDSPPPPRRHNERILHHGILQLARVGVCVRCARGPTKRCITLPRVNKPRGRGLARGSPLRLRLLLPSLHFLRRYRHPVHSHLRASTTIFFSLPPIPCLSFVRDHPRTFPHSLFLSLPEIVPRPQTPLAGWSPANYFLPGELI